MKGLVKNKLLRAPARSGEMGECSQPFAASYKHLPCCRPTPLPALWHGGGDPLQQDRSRPQLLRRGTDGAQQVSVGPAG